ncbi:MAG: hypothetical protein WCV84_05435 [Patescibacteria group bacterium]
MRKKIVFGALAAFLLSAGVVGASSYEWINPFSIPEDDWHGEDVKALSWTVNTSSNFYEYRTVYYATTTSGSPSSWTEFTGCRHEGYVNGTADDGCDFTAPYYPGPNHNLWIRITTNFAGCSPNTYTAEPAEGCGDYREKGFPFYQ